MADNSGHVSFFATFQWLYIKESSGNLQVFLECIFRVTVFNVFKGTVQRDLRWVKSGINQ